jgi:DNA-binding transcriptional MerR regulator
MGNPVSLDSEAPFFDDGKEPGALRTIGEVAKALGIKHHVLRYWEEQFPTLSPLTRAGGRRYYRVEDVALLREIDRLLHHEGYTIRGARLAIEAAGKGGAHAAGSTPSPPHLAGADPLPRPAPETAPEAQVNEIIAALRVLRSHLEGIHGRLTAALQD